MMMMMMIMMMNYRVTTTTANAMPLYISEHTLILMKMTKLQKVLITQVPGT